MRLPILVIVCFLTVSALVLWLIARRCSLDRGEVIDCAGYLLVVASLILLYFQTLSGITSARRRATHDFIHGPVALVLEPREKQLRDLLNRPVLLFQPNEVLELSELERDSGLRPLILDILNFYERIAISIRIGVLDGDLLYDDKGLQALPSIDGLDRSYSRYKRNSTHASSLISRHSRCSGNGDMPRKAGVN